MHSTRLASAHQITGRIEALSSLFTDQVHNSIFLIGIDRTDPAMPDGSAMLFSGDDEYYGQITGRLPREAIEDLAIVLRTAAQRIRTIMRSAGR